MISHGEKRGKLKVKERKTMATRKVCSIVHRSRCENGANLKEIVKPWKFNYVWSIVVKRKSELTEKPSGNMKNRKQL